MAIKPGDHIEYISGIKNMAAMQNEGKMKLLTGKGWYLWILSECGTPQEIADLAIINGIAHLMPKIADGIYDYNKANGDPAKQLTLAAQKLGMDVWGWQYVYLANPTAEADKAYQRIQETGCTGFVIDAEGEWKGQMQFQQSEDLLKYLPKGADYFKALQHPQWELAGGAEKASQYLSHLRDLVGPDFPLALSSYRYPSYHPEFPWDVARSFVDMDMPQVYWLLAHNPVEQLNKSYGEFQAFSRKLPYLPTGAAWKEHGWAPTAAEISSFIAQCEWLKVPGYNFWSYQHAKRDLPDVWKLLMPNEEEPGIMPSAIRVNRPNDYANIRNKIWGTITGKAPHGLTLFVTDQATDPNDGRLWYICGTGYIASWTVEVIG